MKNVETCTKIKPPLCKGRGTATAVEGLISVNVILIFEMPFFYRTKMDAFLTVCPAARNCGGFRFSLGTFLFP